MIAKTPDDPKDVAHDQATCAVIGTVSRNRLFLELHGNYNPNFEKTALETSKAQFQIIAPTDYPQLNADFDQGTEHLRTLQRSIIKEGPDPEHFVVMDGLRPALKFSWPLFEKRVSLNLVSPSLHAEPFHHRKNKETLYDRMFVHDPIGLLSLLRLTNNL